MPRPMPASTGRQEGEKMPFDSAIEAPAVLRTLPPTAVLSTVADEGANRADALCDSLAAPRCLHCDSTRAVAPPRSKTCSVVESPVNPDVILVRSSAVQLDRGQLICTDAHGRGRESVKDRSVGRVAGNRWRGLLGISAKIYRFDPQLGCSRYVFPKMYPVLARACKTFGTSR
jgi:hypothetical protein